MRGFLKPQVSTSLIALAWLLVAGAFFGRFAHRVLVPPVESPHYFVLVAPVSALVAFLWCAWLLLCAVPNWRATFAMRKVLLVGAFLTSTGLLGLVVIRA